MIYFILAGLALVAGVLFLGFFNMVRPDRSPMRAQKLMRLRVWSQLGVIALLALAACWAGFGG